jgi:cytochrome b561
MKDTQRYTWGAIALHWLIAILMIFMLFFGEDLIRSRDAAQAPFLASLHVSIGVTILLLSLARLLWRLGHPPPPLPATMKRWERQAAHWTHILFYVLMIGLPVTGWLAFTSFAAQHSATALGTQLYGLARVPVAPEVPGMGDVHAIGSNIGIAILVLHVAAALKHQFIDRDGTLMRMLGRG